MLDSASNRSRCTTPASSLDTSASIDLDDSPIPEKYLLPAERAPQPSFNTMSSLPRCSSNPELVYGRIRGDARTFRSDRASPSSSLRRAFSGLGTSPCSSSLRAQSPLSRTRGASPESLPNPHHMATRNNNMPLVSAVEENGLGLPSLSAVEGHLHPNFRASQSFSHAGRAASPPSPDTRPHQEVVPAKAFIPRIPDNTMSGNSTSWNVRPSLTCTHNTSGDSMLHTASNVAERHMVTPVQSNVDRDNDFMPKSAFDFPDRALTPGAAIYGAGT